MTLSLFILKFYRIILNSHDTSTDSDTVIFSNEMFYNLYVSKFYYGDSRFTSWENRDQSFFFTPKDL